MSVTFASLTSLSRGRKIFRRFDSPSRLDDDGDAQDAATSDTANLKRKAGAVASRPFTRSSLKPRLLFPSEEQLRERDADAHDDEEAMTDIEEERIPLPPPKAAQNLATPVKKASFTPATPPSSHRAVRSASKKMSFMSTVEYAAMIDDQHGPSSAMSIPQTRTKPISPFDTWQRTKPGVSDATKSKKRTISPLPEETSVSKRTRTRTGAFSAEHE